MSKGFAYTMLMLTIASVGGFNNNLALILQKCANKEYNRDGEFNKTRWVLGFMYYTAAAITYGGSLPYVDFVLLTIVCAINVVFGLLLSVYTLGEKFDVKRDSIAIGFIIAGSAVIVSFSHKGQEVYTLDELKEMFVRPPAIAYEVCTVVLIVVALGSLALLLLKMNQLSRQLDHEEQLDLLTGGVETSRKQKSYK